MRKRERDRAREILLSKKPLAFYEIGSSIGGHNSLLWSIFGRFWAILEDFGHFGIIWGPFWVDFGSFLGGFWPAPEH